MIIYEGRLSRINYNFLRLLRMGSAFNLTFVADRWTLDNIVASKNNKKIIGRCKYIRTARSRVIIISVMRDGWQVPMIMMGLMRKAGGERS